VYGGAACGKKVMTSSSSPGISLKQEGISYIAGAELPCLIVNVVRGGPGLGTIQPAQSDYFQSVKGGGHGDYKLIVLAPASVQEMADFVDLGFDLAFKYRNPVMILTDGAIGQMMEKVYLAPQKERLKIFPEWATTGKPATRKRNIITSLDLDPYGQELFIRRLEDKYEVIKKAEVRFEEFQTEDAEYLLVAYGTSARVCQKSIQIAREQGIKVGLLRPITLFPFPTKRLIELAAQVKGMISVEMSSGILAETGELLQHLKRWLKI
jgi:2-oxoglutarate ferredoxin oxidoreductase subunit alpha